MHVSLRVPEIEIEQRIHALQGVLGSTGLHGALIVQRMDLLYFSGCAQNAYLYVPRSGSPLLLVRKHAGRAAQDSPIPTQIPIQSVREIPDRILTASGRSPRVLGLVWDALPVREFRFLRRLFPSRAYVDISETVHRLRGAKSLWERERISVSADLCLETLTHLQVHAFPGMPETALAGLAEAFARQHGHGGGVRVRNPSQDNRSCRLSGCALEIPERGAFSVGFHAAVNGYHASRARIFTPPSLSEDQQRDILALETLHERILQRSASATSTGDVRRSADAEVSRFLRSSPGLDVHFFFHGIGLEVVEPVFDDQDARSWTDQALCLTIETSGKSPQGPALSLQDTVVLDAKGLHLL